MVIVNNCNLRDLFEEKWIYTCNKLEQFLKSENLDIGHFKTEQLNYEVKSSRGTYKNDHLILEFRGIYETIKNKPTQSETTFKILS